MDTVCRTCLTLGDLSPIFSCPGQHEHYTAVLFITTGLKIELNDGLPQGICHSCTQLINSALRLRDQSHHARQILLDSGFRKVARFAPKACNTLAYSSKKTGDSSSRIKKSCKGIGIDISKAPAILENVGFKSELALLKEEDLVTKVEVVVDLEDNANSDDPAEAEKILPDVKKKNAGTHKYIKVIRKYEKGLTLKQRLEEKRIQRNKIRATKEEKSTTEKDKYIHLVEGPYKTYGPVKCSICKKVLSRMDVFVKHVKRHFKGEYVCEQCGRLFHLKAGLINHCMRRHGAEKKLQCDHCDYKAVERPQLDNHVARVHTGARPFICDVCGAGFTCKPDMRQHLRIHFAAKTVQCDQCPAMFKSRSSLSTHSAKKHRLNYRFYCYLCPKTYTGRYSARKHLERHHGVPRHLQGPVRFSKWTKGMPPPPHPDDIGCQDVVPLDEATHASTTGTAAFKIEHEYAATASQ